MTIFLTVCFIALMLLVIRPLAARLVDKLERREVHSKGLVAGVLIFSFASALLTEVIGIHALFGAFLAGAIMPSTCLIFARVSSSEGMPPCSVNAPPICAVVGSKRTRSPIGSDRMPRKRAKKRN